MNRENNIESSIEKGKKPRKRLIVLSSPSGGGKSTLAKHLMSLYPYLMFSVSATTRKQREGEVDEKDYYFLSRNDFLQKIADEELVEYEEIFGNIYGTLKSEIRRVLNANDSMLFDVDVKGALSLKKHFPEDTLLIFIYPPSLEELERRLVSRSTETTEEINNRLLRAEEEMGFKDEFDELVENDNLQHAFETIEKVTKKYKI